ncbi:MAG: hypothetical protein V4502_05380 [Pseudomonadota bacterium]
MAHKALIATLSMIAAAVPVSAAGAHSTPNEAPPPRTPNTEYCMWVEPVTGSRLETVQCWTREEWAEAGVDVDKDWPKEGVYVKERG